MYHNYKFASVNEALPALLKDLLNADEVASRAGRTFELTHVGITLTQPLRREITLGERKPNIAAQIAETVWVLSGRDDITWLSHYLPRVFDFSDDGETWRAGYGRRIRHWSGHNRVYDQLAHVVAELRKSSMTRQAVISIWDPSIDSEPGKDIPCNDWITFLNRSGQLDMHVGIRSNDVIWGWSGINQFEWSAMLEIVAGLVGVRPGALHFSTTSFHIYDRHWDKAASIIKDAQHTPAPLFFEQSPRFDANQPVDVAGLDRLFQRWFSIEEKIRQGSAPNVEISRAIDAFPEPMLQSWLRVIHWWWTGNRSYLTPELAGTPLEYATHKSVQPKREAPFSEAVQRTPSAFIKAACELHLEKHAAYGDSWKRRGEMLGIMANIARKVDRLGRGETSDETSADTAMDLMIYLAKYRTWLEEQRGAVTASGLGTLSGTPDYANEVLLACEIKSQQEPIAFKDPKQIEVWLEATFNRLEDAVNRDDKLRHELVEDMLLEAYRLARTLWENQTDYCKTCGAAEENHAPGGSRYECAFVSSKSTDQYQGADHD